MPVTRWTYLRTISKWSFDYCTLRVSRAVIFNDKITRRFLLERLRQGCVQLLQHIPSFNPLASILKFTFTGLKVFLFLFDKVYCYTILVKRLNRVKNVTVSSSWVLGRREEWLKNALPAGYTHNLYAKKKIEPSSISNIRIKNIRVAPLAGEEIIPTFSQRCFLNEETTEYR